MAGFEIASGVLAREGTHVSDHGADYDAAIERLRERGGGASTWGDDGLFGIIAAAYSECAQVSLAALTGLAGEITSTGEALSRVATNTRDTEDAIIDDIGRVTWS